MTQEAATLEVGHGFVRQPPLAPIGVERIWSLVELALSLTERLSGAYPPMGPEPDQIGASRYQHWASRLTSEDYGLFERRLRWDGLHPRDVQLALGRLRMPRSQPLPDWAQLLLEVIDKAREHVTRPCLSDQQCDPVPFEEILRPFVEVGVQRLSRLRPGRQRFLHPSAISDAESALLRVLSSLSAQALFAEFSSFRSRSDLLAAAMNEAAVPAPRQLYRTFVRDMLSSGLLPFFERYAVLGRLLTMRVIQWCVRTAELFARLEKDWPELETVFHPDRPAGRVRRMRSDLSDSHDGWRTVCILEFDSGSRIVYKPRALAAEEAYAKLVHWLNANGASPALGAAVVLTKDGYGWMQYIESSPCADRDAVERYYERAGMLLCLTRILGSGDFHAENVIARGEYPILVDLELLQGARVLAEREVAGSPPNLVGDLLWDSVMRSMLLPCETIGPGGETYQSGGFGGGTLPTVTTLVWRNVNSDAMAQRTVQGPVRAYDNLPLFDGAAQPLEQYVSSLERGFAAMHRLLTAKRDDLLGSGGPLEGPGFDYVRVIIRPTQTYATVLARCTHPRFLSSGVDGGIELDLLCHSRISQNQVPPLLWPAFRAERADLEKLDVPRFTARTDDEWLRDASGSRLLRYCAHSPRAGTVHRLRGLGREERKRQLRFISLSFRGLSLDRRLRDVQIKGSLLTADAAVQEASAIADLVDSLAYPSRTGKFWYGIVHDSESADLKDLGDGLYLGSAGPAILHAALYAVTHDSRHRAAAMACFERSLRRLASRNPTTRRRLRSGGCGIGGLGGTTYALAVSARLLGSAELRLASTRAAAAMYPPHPTRNSPADLVSGSSGALIALLAAYRLNGNQALLDQANAWSERLIRDRTRDPRSGLLAWRNPNGIFRAALGKGVAGVVCALIDMNRETGRTEFLDAAAEGWAFIDSARDAERGGWPIPSPADDEESRTAVQRAWCLGSSGIGLAATFTHPNVGGMIPRIDHALDHLQSLDSGGVIDNCCCGFAGHMDLLMEAGRVLERPDLVAASCALACAMARKARRRGSYDTAYGAVYAPGFFKGLAGIGYQILRLHHADILPSVLMLDSNSWQ